MDPSDRTERPPLGGRFSGPKVPQVEERLARLAQDWVELAWATLPPR